MIKNPNLKLKASFTPNSQLPCPSPNPLAVVRPLTRSRPLDIRRLIGGAVEASSEPPLVSVETPLCAAASSVSSRGEKGCVEPRQTAGTAWRWLIRTGRRVAHNGGSSLACCDVMYLGYAANSEIQIFVGDFERFWDNGMSHRTKSAGSGDSSSNGDRICKCGLVARMKVSNSEANPGREYFSCPDGKCRWFRWAGPPVNRPARVVGQNCDRDAEEAQLGLRSCLLAHDRIRKIEYDCVTLKLFACVHLTCIVFCLVLIMVVLFKS
ncbi:hypothetical protein PIB30_075829 [Stylosanthes scabra]|uniref:GRF-type domain-containing protein n=1 Tax=Stylosanthes scabra TaxID=79078 RepID=A0ABU6WQW0_9FABA|nr:hypothetical protein [Stylosanthes scabra]